MLAQQDRDVAHERYIPHHAPDHIPRPIQIVLPARIQLRVVSRVVVAFGQQP